MTKRFNPYERLTTDELESLIECYFDCSLSEDDEASLRKVISATRLDSALIREAKAVMGYGAAKRERRMTLGRRLNSRLRAIASVAAAIAVIAAGVNAYHHHDRPTEDVNQCVAYVNGQRIYNKDAVMQMMKVDLLTMQNGSESVAARIGFDLSAMGNAIDERIID